VDLLRRLFGRRATDGSPATSTALDIGTEYAKALVFTTNEDGEADVTGVGRQRQGLSHMQSGTVADIPAVVRNCRAALDEAEAMAGSRSTSVVIGIAGELVKGFTTSLSTERRRPDTTITEAELDRLIEDAERAAMAEAQRTITWETGLPNVDVKLVHATVAGAGIDGYAVTNPIGFQGRHIRITVFNAYAPLVHLAALEAVVARLGLELLKVVAEPYAVARSLGGDQAVQAGALFIDVGGGTTDVALVRQGSVEGTRMFALGGRAFTKSLADRLELSFEDAERVKIDHAAGRTVDQAELVAEIVAEDVAVWSAGVELVLEEFGKQGLLPGRIELCGGGAGLPEIRGALEVPGFASGLPFSRRPSVSLMMPGEVSAVHDRTGLLVDQQDVTPMALAVQALEAKREREPLEAALERVLRAMRSAA
jgi:cell division protein FtsA